MKRTKMFMMYLVMAVVALFASAVLTSVGSMAGAGPDPGLVLPVMTVALFAGMAFTERKQGVSQAIGGIDVEFWTTVLMDVLFPKNSFFMRSVDHSEYVTGKVVHVPNAGAVPGLARERSAYPGTVSQRTDVDLTYNIIEYTTDPTHITKKEQTTIAYDKVASILRTHSQVILKGIAEDLNFAWSGAGAAQLLRTTGADSTRNLSPSATGTRKQLTTADLSAAMTKLNLQDIPEEGRVCLLPSQMYEELLNDPDLKKRDVAKEADYKNGILARLYGFDIMQRSSSTIFDDTATPVKKAVGAAAAATDNLAALCWQQDSVSRAVGEVKPFQDNDNPVYYGDILSALARAGGRQMRNDGKGVISIVQTVGA